MNQLSLIASDILWGKNPLINYLLHLEYNWGSTEKIMELSNQQLGNKNETFGDSLIQYQELAHTIKIQWLNVQKGLSVPLHIPCYYMQLFTSKNYEV